MKIFILYFFIFSSFTLIRFDEDESNVYDLGQIKLTFINAGECGCDESCSFSKSTNNSFLFSIPTNFNQNNKIRVDAEFDYDSLFVYQREFYQYALIVSETEGVRFYYYDSTLKIQDMYKVTAWRFRPLNSTREFSIIDTFESKPNSAMMPALNKEKAELFLLKSMGYQESESEKFRKESRFGVFVSSIEIRLKYYIKGKIKRTTLVFDYRHGEC